MQDQAPDLDLHKFYRDPDKARAIIDICIADCIQKNIGLVRVVHGKGKGDFRALIHSYLDKHHIRLKNIMDINNNNENENPVKISDSKNEQISDGVAKPFPPWIRRILLLILLAASFVVFPQWIARAGMVFLVAFMEFRLSQPDSDD
ncbi:MAG: Smr/MutS family protein [bacterium]|nr:Smr/MutS family protein [bacterium]